MKKLIAFVFCLFLVANSALFAQGISCPAVTATPDTTLNCGGCVTLEATPVSGFQPTNYTVQQIPFSPYPLTGTNILLNIDDTWSAVLPIGFDFCFYGNTYNSLVIGSNGVVSFDLTYAGGYCQWPINNAIPSPAAQNPVNCIMAAFHDIDPSVTGNVRWAQYGSAPCRVFVVNFDAVAMFSCNSSLSTSQIVIYETTNVIETYLHNKPLCSTWNSGAAIHGIQNANGTQAVVVPGRNYPAQWTASNDAWAFIPNGAPNYSTSWYVAGQTTPFANADTVTVCPQSSEDYVAVTTYINCNGDSVIVQDTASISTQSISPIVLSETHTDVTCFGANDGTATVTVQNGIPPYTYVWSPSGGNGPTATGLGPGVYTCTVADTTGCGIDINVTILEPAELVGSVDNVTDASCFGGTDGSITVSAIGGTPPIASYNWTPNVSSGPTAFNLPAGSYQVVIVDANGCDDTLTAVVNQPPQITSTVSTTPVTCFGGNDGTASVNPSGGTGGFTFLWLPSGQFTQTATGLSPGPQVVIITDAAGCQDTNSVVVTQPAQIQLVISATDATCNGAADGTATVVATGGSGALNYAWTPSGGSNPTATGLGAGTYTVVVTDANGCSNSAQVTVNEPAPLQINMFETAESCWNACDGNVTAQPVGGTGPYTFQWNTPNNDVTQTVQQLCNGWYTVTATDANGCSAIDSVEVGFPPSPIGDAGPDVSFCEGEGGAMLTGTATGGSGAPYYYQWTCNAVPCGLSCTNCANPIANPTDTTTYYLVVFDQNGCGGLVDSVQVNVIPKPRVDAGPDVSICGDPNSPGTVLNPTVTGFGPYQYNWTPGAGLSDSTIANPFARPDTTTIYALIVTDLATGCTSDFTTTDTVATVTVTVSPQPIAEAGPDRTICAGDTTVLIGTGSGAGPSYSFQWSPTNSLSSSTSPNPEAWPSLTTEYILTVFSNGCPSYGDTVRVTVESLPTISAGPDRDYCWGSVAQLDGVVDSLTFSPGMTYNWSPGITLNDSTIEDPIAFPDVTTQYYFSAVTANGCFSAMDSMLVTIRPTPIVDAGPDIVWCQADSVIDLNGILTWANGNPPGDQQNVILDWGPDALIIGDDDETSVTVSPTNNTWFYFTALYDSCSHTDSVLISVIPEIGAMVSADTTTVCEGDSVYLVATGGIGGAGFTWLPSSGVGDPASPITAAAPDTTTTYVVAVEEGGCLDSAEITINVIPSPDVAFVNSFNDGCAPLDVSFTSVSTDAISLIWDFGDGSPTVNSDAPFHTFAEPGDYNVTLYGINSGGCIDSSQALTFSVYDTIAAEFTSNPLYPVELVIPGTTVNFTDLSENAVTWIWEFGNGQFSDLENPATEYRQPGEYMVTLHVTNEHGCSSMITHGPYIVMVPELFIPNVFSPNNDGINDGFWVEYSGDQPFTIAIFDRWGTQIFQTKNKVQKWDGTLEGAEMPEGTYYYKLRIGDKDYAGDITLVR